MTCNAPDWLVSQYIIPIKKSPRDAALTKFFDHLLILLNTHTYTDHFNYNFPSEPSLVFILHLFCKKSSVG